MSEPTAPDSRQSIPQNLAVNPHEMNLPRKATRMTQTVHPQIEPFERRPRSVLSPLLQIVSHPLLCRVMERFVRERKVLSK